MKNNHLRGFVPYGAAALLIGIVGGFTAGLGPAFVQDIGIPYSNVTWMTLALAVSSAACAPVLGKLGDLLGRRTTLQLGVAVFALGNMLTAIASSLGFMLMARFIVGVGTAAVTPVILAYIVTEFPREDTARGFSLYMLISSSGVIFGPTLGGLLVAVAGWRTMMWLCAAISGGILLFCLFWGRGEAEGERSATGRFDLWGGALVLVFFGLVLCIPSFGQTLAGPPCRFCWFWQVRDCLFWAWPRRNGGRKTRFCRAASWPGGPFFSLWRRSFSPRVCCRPT